MVTTVISSNAGPGGQQAAASAIAELLRLENLPVELVNLTQEAQRRPFLRIVERCLSAVSENAILLLLPWLVRFRRGDVCIIFRGNALFVAPVLRAMGVAVICVSDRPRRLASREWRSGLERLRSLFLLWCTVIRTYPGDGERYCWIPSPLRPSEPAAFPVDRPKGFAFVGRLTREKGIEAFLDLAASMPDMHFAVFGSGPLEDLVRRAAASTVNLTFPGFDRCWPARLRAEELVLLGCCATEACWTAGREALLNGIPTISRQTEAGGPECYEDYTEWALTAPSLEATVLRQAIERLSLVRSPSPAIGLFNETEPRILAHFWRELVEGVGRHQTREAP